jgi:hypothetical protein
MTLDWQTIVVTLVALGAAAAVARRFIPKRRRAGAPAASAACDHCESGAAAIKGAPQGSTTRTETTPVVSLDDLRASAKRR